MNLFSPTFWVLLLNLSTPTVLPSLDVQVLVGTAQPKNALVDKTVTSAELNRTFRNQNLNHFYLLDEVTISFNDSDKRQQRTLSLPEGRSAQFKYTGRTPRHHVLEFSLPDYKVLAQLRVPESRTFYQAGIKHEDGMIILKMRLNPFKK